MAYFEFGYVNTGYDENSAEAPVSSEYNAITNFVSSIRNGVQESIIDFNYDVTSGVAEESIFDFKYNVFSEFAEKIVDFPNDINVLFENQIVDLNYKIDLPVFEHAKYEFNYNVGEKTSPSVLFVKRLNEDD